MSYFLVFDAECAPCTQVAAAIRDLKIENLSVVSRTDPSVRQAFERSGRDVPGVPALVRVEGNRVRCWTGMALRVRLARLVGVHRARTLVRLLVLEASAKARRRGSGKSLTRRRLLGGAAAGAGLAIFARGTATAAAGGSSGMRAATSAERDRALARAEVREAAAVWGVTDEQTVTVLAAGTSDECVALSHAGGTTVTYLDTAVDSSAAVTIVTDRDAGALKFFLPEGTPVAVATRDGDAVRVSAAKPGSGPRGVEPMGRAEFVQCMVLCLGAHIDGDYVVSCIGCAAGGLLSCAACAYCAGPKAVRCVKHCSHFL
ncbi:hypothetical protein [Amycolatopsis sp. CA-230715]|uniref:hypothetical protein n=1 Tax=Amycolatopsis sp. CA-230715 TaxID=2745196 RepID=UPI001C026C15|nr:hypothetical protein [Amycolatopsis sp. CA-230715]QWF85839.1 hypothetical protein HUW46_09319 [Amycolatopsis sp. CA-230715]